MTSADEKIALEIVANFQGEINWGFGDCGMFAVAMRTIFPKTKMMVTSNHLHVFVEFSGGEQIDFSSYPLVSNSYRRLTQGEFHHAPGIDDWDWNLWADLLQRVEQISGRSPRLTIATPYLSAVRKMQNLLF